MSKLASIYRTSFGLLTDLYQLTMACGYWKEGLAATQSIFHLTFRRHPFGGQYAVACGLRYVVDMLDELQFDDSDLEYLATLQGSNNDALFDPAFLEYLRTLKFSCNVDAVPEGTIVFAHEPLVRITGPLLQAQIVETALLNIVNFQTLVATKAARLRQAVGTDHVLEFGLRRAQGVDGGLAASRAAYIGGCNATSNVLAGKLFDIPVKGTHAHSWVMAFDDEEAAFDSYADAMPNNCVFLVDTFDTIEGVRKAVRVGKRLRKRGYEMNGIRLDSGDLAELSKRARVILDEAGFREAAIVASNDLDECAIRQLKRDGARIDVWGVGTKLATAFDQPALGGVYKLSALHDGEVWQPKIKLSEDSIKVSVPGKLQVRRFFGEDNCFAGDMLFDELATAPPSQTGLPMAGGDAWRSEGATHEDLLVPIFRGGERVYRAPSIHDSRSRAASQVGHLPDSVMRWEEPKTYRVMLEERLHQTRQRLIEAAGGQLA